MSKKDVSTGKSVYQDHRGYYKIDYNNARIDTDMYGNSSDNNGYSQDADYSHSSDGGPVIGILIIINIFFNIFWAELAALSAMLWKLRIIPLAIGLYASFKLITGSKNKIVEIIKKNNYVKLVISKEDGKKVRFANKFVFTIFAIILLKYLPVDPLRGFMADKIFGTLFQTIRGYLVGCYILLACYHKRKLPPIYDWILFVLEGKSSLI